MGTQWLFENKVPETMSQSEHLQIDEISETKAMDLILSGSVLYNDYLENENMPTLMQDGVNNRALEIEDGKNIDELLNEDNLELLIDKLGDKLVSIIDKKVSGKKISSQEEKIMEKFDKELDLNEVTARINDVPQNNLKVYSTSQNIKENEESDVDEKVQSLKSIKKNQNISSIQKTPPPLPSKNAKNKFFEIKNKEKIKKKEIKTEETKEKQLEVDFEKEVDKTKEEKKRNPREKRIADMLEELKNEK